MPPPPTRKEQLQLDELLSDIYRGIEALPDKSANSTTGTYHYNKSSSSVPIVARTHVKEYELPASSPLVKQHLAALREDQYSPRQASQLSSGSKQPQRSTLKRNTATPDIYNSTRAAPQSLASFVTSTPTPENKRRVRIIDQPESLGTASYRARDNYNYNYNYGDQDGDGEADYAADYEENSERRRRPGEKVKYVNTNKLIYHQERNPDDEDEGVQRQTADTNEIDEDDDLEGKTRVEYYHTTWLDRQLGRASKRRSSKELNERQVKEKAMIEELKRSLKSGAITLRQSLRGKKNNKHNSDNTTFADDYQIDSSLDSHNNSYSSKHHHSHNHSNHHHHKSNPIGSGLATLPRNYGKVYHQATPVCYDTWVSKRRGSTSPNKTQPDHHHHHNHQAKHHTQQYSTISTKAQEPISGSFIIEEPRNSYYPSSAQSQYQPPRQQTPTTTTPKQTNNFISNNNNNNNNNNNYNSSTLNNRMQPQYQTRQAEQTTTSSNLYSRTLPYKSSKRGEHSLIESHLRGNSSIAQRNYPGRVEPAAAAANSSTTLPYPASSTAATARETPTTMRNPSYASQTGGLKSPTGHSSAACLDQHPVRQRPGDETISNIPSATEVVRSALSRSSSQVSLNQLNKTINLLPNSPPPYSPSPSGGRSSPQTQQLKPKSPPMSPSPARCSTQDWPQRLYGTRTLDRSTTGQQQQQQQPTRQPIYANPHASLMQHKAEQQARQPIRNTASVREFNELDSLLRSLSPAITQYQQSSAHITPGFSSKPAQSSIGGYGFTAPAAAPNTARPTTGNELYSRVQRPGAGTSIYQTPAAAAAVANDQTKASYLHQNYALANQQQQTHQPFTIDVSNKKSDENCFKRQELSEFEAPIELLPSMEDYQNITKLNPVKNHHWYKPNMSRERAISLLKDKPQGTFIVRDSNSFRGAYGLALKVAKLPKNVLNNASLRNYNSNDPSAELIRHFLIEPTPSGVRLKGYENEPIFNSLPDLIYQHSLTELALPCKLIIPRADIEDPNFNLKQKQFFDDFVASKEQAKHLPYERTSPDGGYRKYPGNVYVHNEHRIIFE